MNPEDFIGKKFGSYTVIHYEYKTNPNESLYLVMCECGFLCYINEKELLKMKKCNHQTYPIITAENFEKEMAECHKRSIEEANKLVKQGKCHWTYETHNNGKTIPVLTANLPNVDVSSTMTIKFKD